MTRYWRYALAAGLALEFWLFYSVVSVASAQDIAGTVGDIATDTASFTNSVNIFNFVVVAMVVSFGVEKVLDYRKSKLDRDEYTAARKALNDQFIAQQNLQNQNMGLYLQAINTIVSLHGVVSSSVETLKATQGAIDSIVGTAITSLSSERIETAQARAERDLIYNEYRRTFDQLHTVLADVANRLRAAYPPLSPTPPPGPIGAEGVNLLPDCE